MIKIGFAVAMADELNDFLNTLEKPETVTRGAFTVYVYRLSEKELCVIKTGVGEIRAAAATQILISEFHVDVVINFGVCGKLSPRLSVLDTVVVKSVVHYAFDTSAIDDCPKGKYECFDSVFIPADEKLLNLALSLDSSVKAEICASADKFVADKEEKQNLFEQYGAAVCEMEAAGVLMTSIAGGVPCLLIKSVSDDCCDMDFREYLAAAAKKHIELVMKIINKL